MSTDFPHANARLTEVARHWADGELSQDAWRRERRHILGELCRKRTDCEGKPGAATAAPAPAVRAAEPAVVPSPVPVVLAPAARPGPEEAPANDDEVLMLGVLLVAVIGGALLIFFLV